MSSRLIRARLLADEAHYEDLVLSVIRKARVSLWIATANLKTMLVEAPIGSRARARGKFISFYESLADLAAAGVEVRLLHASPPSGPLAREMAKLKKTTRVSMKQCPRVHLKMVAVDGRELYLGSANVTGAGLGAKGEGRRNFEMGIVTDDDGMLDAAQAQFDRIWRGRACKGCKVRSSCPAPLDEPRTRPARPAPAPRSASLAAPSARPPRSAASPPARRTRADAPRSGR